MGQTSPVSALLAGGESRDREGDRFRCGRAVCKGQKFDENSASLGDVEWPEKKRKCWEWLCRKKTLWSEKKQLQLRLNY